MKIIPDAGGSDVHDIRFLNSTGEEKGFGYKSKEDSSLGLIRCPDCERENYAANVATGTCTWCKFSMYTDTI